MKYIFSWVTLIILFLAMWDSYYFDEYYNLAIFTVSFFNVGMWLWLENK